MALVNEILLRAFGRPKGLLGRLGGALMARTNRPMAERVIELIDVAPMDRVLEVGFGPGVGIELLSRAASRGFVAGVDVSDEMVARARTRNADACSDGRVDLRLGSAESLPFESSTFDKAVSINSLQVWSDVMAGLREIHRVLRPGGKLIVGFTRHSRQSKHGLPDRLVAADFRDLRVVDVLDGDGFCVLATK